VKRVEADLKVRDLVQFSTREAFEERTGEIRRGAIGIRVNANQRVRAGRESKGRPGAREFDDEGAAFDGRDPSDPQLRVEAMGEVISLIPGRQPL
jgi:hypothetical protein